jgi:UDP-glucoronosyl and UDP-glucosyl transferase
MRVLFTTLPAVSHFRALVPVAQAARHLGHVVGIAAPQVLHPDIQRYGFETLAAGRDWRPEQEVWRPELLSMLGSGAGDIVGTYVLPFLTGESALCMANDLLALAPSWQPEVVLRDPLEFGGYLAAEVLGIPHVSIGVFGGVAKLSQRLPAEDLNAHRALLNLPADPGLMTLGGILHANLMPPSYDPAELKIPTARCYRHTNPTQVDEKLPGWVSNLPGTQPLILAAMGTLFHMVPGRLEAMIAALADLECTAIIAVGAGKNISSFGPQPSNVKFVKWICQPLLLECCDLFVTHGGFNSVRESLRFGVPMVIAPVMGDQPYNAARCTELGLARALTTDAASPAAMRDACHEVLEDPAFRRRARTMQRQILALPSLETLIRDLELLTGEMKLEHIGGWARTLRSASRTEYRQSRR